MQITFMSTFKIVLDALLLLLLAVPIVRVFKNTFFLYKENLIKEVWKKMLFKILLAIISFTLYCVTLSIIIEKYP